MGRAKRSRQDGRSFASRPNPLLASTLPLHVESNRNTAGPQAVISREHSKVGNDCDCAILSPFADAIVILFLHLTPIRERRDEGRHCCLGSWANWVWRFLPASFLGPTYCACEYIGRSLDPRPAEGKSGFFHLRLASSSPPYRITFFDLICGENSHEEFTLLLL
jgi:hypothetical protein